MKETSIIALSSSIRYKERYQGTWYPQDYRFLGLNYHIHPPFEKSLIERTIQQYIKDRTKSFDEYLRYVKVKCRQSYVQNWLTLFVSMHNRK